MNIISFIRIVHERIEEKLKAVSFTELKMNEYLEHEGEKNKAFGDWTDLIKNDKVPEKRNFIIPEIVFKRKIDIGLGDQEILETNTYGEELEQSLIKSSISPEIMVFLLKLQLIEYY